MLIIFFEKYTPLTTGGMGGIFSEQQRCTLRLSVLWRNLIGSLFLSTYTTLYSLFSDFSLSPVFTAVDFGIAALHRDRLMSVIGFVRRLLRLLIILRPDTLLFLTGERISVFFRGLLCLASFLVSPDSKILPLSFCFQMLLRWLWSQPDKQRKFFRE